MKRLIIAVLGIFAGAIAGSAFAATPIKATTTFTVTYTVATKTCTVSSPQVEVPMGAHLSDEFGGSGTMSSPANFTLTLDCPANVNGVEIQFDGTSVSGDATTLALDTASSGDTAGGVGVALFDKDSQPVTLGMPTAVEGTPEGTVNLAFTARYKALQGDVTPGEADATATFTTLYP